MRICSRPIWYVLSALRDPWTIRRAIPQMREYASDLFRDEGSPQLTSTTSRVRLGIVGGYPVLDYVRLGYDWLAPYYNPIQYFEEVHYFQHKPCRAQCLDFGYPFYVHSFSDDIDVETTCRRFEIDILRAYDANTGRIASNVAKVLQIPVIISIH